MEKHKKSSSMIQQVSYNPPEEHRLDIEIFSIAERAKTVNPAGFGGTHRIDFHLLIFATRGQFTHAVDFVPISCQPGSILTLRPAQTQRIDIVSRWDGWFVMFRPEFLLPLQTSTPLSELTALGNLETLPVHFTVPQNEYASICESIAQMHRDTKLNAPSMELHALLRHQLYALLLRLHLIHSRQEAPASISAVNMQRFNRFQKMVEKNFSVDRQVAPYARLLGVSEKSLTRATLEVTGMTAKAFIAARVTLEAKRLLAHTVLPVAAIADQIGFDETTNFVKFFKREAGCSPGDFRQQQAH